MTQTYEKISACAQSIVKMVGHFNALDLSLVTSGRSPVFLEVGLEDLLESSIYRQIDTSTRHRIASVLERELRVSRTRLQQQYLQLARQYRSLSHCGLPDVDVETSLIQMFEVQYRSHLKDVQAMLVRLLNRPKRIEDNRNTRGGFGDVSSPSITQS